MGENLLQIENITFTNKDTGEEFKIDYLDSAEIYIDKADTKDYTSYNLVNASGELILTSINKKIFKNMIDEYNYKILGKKNKYYKYDKRVKNRKVLHEKLKKQGRR